MIEITAAAQLPGASARARRVGFKWWWEHCGRLGQRQMHGKTRSSLFFTALVFYGQHSTSGVKLDASFCFLFAHGRPWNLRVQ